MRSIGQRIREVRKERRLTQGRVAKLAGLSTSAISDLENGYQHETTKVLEIARALQIYPDWLQYEKGPRNLTEPAAVAEPSHAAPYSEQWPLVTVEEARVGAEWGKLDEPLRTQIRILVETMVAAKRKSKHTAEEQRRRKEAALKN